MLLVCSWPATRPVREAHVADAFIGHDEAQRFVTRLRGPLRRPGQPAFPEIDRIFPTHFCGVGIAETYGRPRPTYWWGL
jgi:hypothetical protein